MPSKWGSHVMTSGKAMKMAMVTISAQKNGAMPLNTSPKGISGLTACTT